MAGQEDRVEFLDCVDKGLREREGERKSQLDLEGEGSDFRAAGEKASNEAGGKGMQSAGGAAQR